MPRCPRGTTNHQNVTIWGAAMSPLAAFTEKSACVTERCDDAAPEDPQHPRESSSCPRSMTKLWTWARPLMMSGQEESVANGGQDPSNQLVRGTWRNVVGDFAGGVPSHLYRSPHS